MTATLDTRPVEDLDNTGCPTPGKQSFDSQIAALAAVAESDAKHGTDNTPYGCVCGKWHNTTHSHKAKPRPKTTSSRIDLEAAAFPDAPLTPPAGLTVGFAILTPKIAAYWLTHHNTHNRNIRPAGTNSLAVDIVTGGWELNGDTIRFSTDGTMLDGQHRCSAVASVGVPVPIILVTGLEPSAQETVDTGAKRTFADTLKLAGETDANNLAALTMAVCLWKAGQYRQSGIKPSVKVLVRVLGDHPELRRHVSLARSISNAVGGAPNSVVGLASWLFDQVDVTDHDDFFAKLASGAGLDAKDPIWTLRESLLRNAAAKAKLPRSELLAYYIKGWNAYRAGTRIHQLKFKSGGANPEAFPAPR